MMAHGPDGVKVIPGVEFPSCMGHSSGRTPERSPFAGGGAVRDGAP